MSIRRTPSTLTSEQTETLRRLAESARRSAQLHADDVAARDQLIWELETNTGNLREVARIAGLAPSHAHRIVLNETARRQSDHD